MDLFFAPTLAGVVLVEAGEITIVALVQGLVLVSFKAALAEFGKDQLEGALGAGERAGVGDIKDVPVGLEALAGRDRLGDALFREVRVFPTGEQVELFDSLSPWRTRTRVWVI